MFVDHAGLHRRVSYQRWWKKLGRSRHPEPHHLTITTDHGGDGPKVWI
jgi:hypothetical protein